MSWPGDGQTAKFYAFLGKELPSDIISRFMIFSLRSRASFIFMFPLMFSHILTCTIRHIHGFHAQILQGYASKYSEGPGCLPCTVSCLVVGSGRVLVACRAAQADKQPPLANIGKPIYIEEFI